LATIKLHIFSDPKDIPSIPYSDLIQRLSSDLNSDAPELIQKEEWVEVPALSDLIGVPDSVYAQISAALNSGKRHLLFYGPPGTGKTTLAEHVAGCLADTYQLVTGSSDWTSQDLIGGYMPVADGELRFFPGIILSDFSSPLIVDELNRCDIDKVIGPLFTVLSGQPTTLPYLVDSSDPDSNRYTILPRPKATPATNEFAPGPEWRLIATLNTLDKASLYQLSYALSRRFAWIYVGLPKDLRQFLIEFARRHFPVLDIGETDEAGSCPLSDIWGAVNSVRQIGPAPFIDAFHYCMQRLDAFNPFAPVNEGSALAYSEACSTYVFPMLDGIVQEDAEDLMGSLSRILAEGGEDLQQSINRELLDLVV
jgi:energy-coupling factor transporter ATP-binding protein EcfA2